MKHTVTTACPLDCWDACSIVATVENGRITSLAGHAEHPITRGFLCGKTLRYPERVYSPDRILHPMLRRANGQFDRIGWDEALDRVAETMQLLQGSIGTESILHYPSGGSMGMLKKLGLRFFSLLGGVTEAAGDICFGAGDLAMEEAMGRPSQHDPRDVEHSRAAIFWGRDPFTTNTHFLPLLKAAKARGTRLLSVNPIRIDGSGLFDRQIQPAPGKDCFLALWIVKRLLADGVVDRTFVESRAAGFDAFRRSIEKVDLDSLLTVAGVSRDDADALLDAYRLRPASTWIGAGVQHCMAGVEVIAILASLAAMTGNIGVPGGGVSFYHRHRTALDATWLAPKGNAARREVPAGVFWRGLDALEPPIRMMWVNGANPVHALPDSDRVVEAMRRIPFVVVVDFHWTDTARLAHLVLPTTSFLEEDGIVTSYGHNLIGRQRRVIDPLGESKSDLAIFQALAERLGFGDELAGDEGTWVDRFSRTLPESTRAALDESGFGDNPGLSAVPWADGRFATKSGRFEFPRTIDLRPFARTAPSAEFPLQLISPKGKRHLLSQTIPSRPLAHSPIAIHPDDARRLGLAAGARVRVASARAEIEAVVEIDEALRPGVVVMSLNGSADPRNNVNRLTPAETSRDGMMPAYYDCFVRVQPNR